MKMMKTNVEMRQVWGWLGYLDSINPVAKLHVRSPANNTPSVANANLYLRGSIHRVGHQLLVILIMDQQRVNTSAFIRGIPVHICRGFILLAKASWVSFSYDQDALNRGTFYVTSGTMLFLGRNFTNDTTGDTEKNGDIELDGDWIHHGSYLDTVGTVYPTGSSQLITGSVSTTYNNQNTQGTDIMTATLDATVTGVLALNDLKMATDTNTLFITYAETSVITRTSGFVSSQGMGSLSRSTGMTIPNLFPVGSSIGTARFRPVEITPTLASPHTFTVRMANLDPTTEGYNISNKQPGVGAVNTNWYHRMNRTIGTSPADMAIFKDVLEPGTEMVHWETEWENSGAVSTTPTGVSKLGWNDFSPDLFALGISYDINVSGLTAVSRGRGGVEISLQFINPNPVGSKTSRQGPSFL